MADIKDYDFQLVQRELKKGDGAAITLSRHHAWRGRAGPSEDETVVAIMAGLVPILWSKGAGSEVCSGSRCP